MSKNFKNFLFVLLCIAAIAMYAAMLLLAIVGEKLRTQEAMGVVFWTSIFFYVLFRRLGKKGWIGAITGVVVGFLALTAADVVAKGKQNTPDYVLSHNPGYLAIQTYDPVEFQRIRTELLALAEQRNLTEEAVAARVSPMLMTVVQKALAHTTDEAVVQYARAKLHNLEEVARANVDDCHAVISGKVPAASASRIVAYSSEQSKRDNREAIVRVIKDAAGRPRRSFDDTARLERLIAQIEVRLKVVGLSVDYVISDAPGPTPKERCAAGIQLFREAMNLKEPDRSFLLRRLLS